MSNITKGVLQVVVIGGVLGAIAVAIVLVCLTRITAELEAETVLQSYTIEPIQLKGSTAIQTTYNPQQAYHLNNQNQASAYTLTIR